MVVLFFLMVVVQPVGAHIDIVWTNQPTASFTADERAVINAAIERWEPLIHDFGPGTQTPVIALIIEKQYADAPFVAASRTLSVALTTHHPLKAKILINSRLDFFVDKTPHDPLEFVKDSRSDYAFIAPKGVCAHEIGHVLGFGSGYNAWGQKRCVVGDSTIISYGIPVQTVLLVGGKDTSHLSDLAHGPDLMTNRIPPGVRYLPSRLDLDILSGIYGYSIHLEPLVPHAESPKSIPAPLWASRDGFTLILA